MSREAEVCPSSELSKQDGHRWVPVCVDDIIMSQRVWSNPYARISAAMRRAMMMTNGLSLNRVVGNREFEMPKSAQFAQMRMDWAKFAHDLDIQLILYGFVLFRVDTQRAVPLVIDPMSVRIYVNIEDGVARYVVSRVERSAFATTQHDIPGIRVIERNAPNFQGRLTCEAISLYAYLIPHDLALDLAPIAWLSEARPTVFIRAKAPGVDETGRLIDTMMNGDANFDVLMHERVAREGRLEQIAEREQRRAENFIRAVQLNQQAPTTGAQTLRAIDTRATMLTPNVFPLPANSEIDQVVHPSFHTNIEEVGNYFAMVVSRLMGVPAFDTGRSGARYTAAVSLTTANDAIRSAASELEVTLSAIATEALMPHAARHTLELARRRKAPGTEEVTDMGHVVVKIHCAMSFDTIQTMYQLGAMNHLQFVEALSHAVHVPPHLLSRKHIDPNTGAECMPATSAGADPNPRPAKRTRRPKTDIEHAEEALKINDGMYTGHPN